MTPRERYTQANAEHMAVAVAIGAIYPRKDPELERRFSATHEARRVAFFAATAHLRASR